ncbi:MAG: glutathione S-transferase [Alphaproteobacteria bacterium RIFCSPHIGHO2_12_FULL_63_12]|nr:MAG: glutathione S-transferase [Alphaproteobacteria bacterium RIFCSPHIGHO2_12_FULL_63_12]
MITVHHLENSRSQRVLWLLEELALPYQVKRYERDKKTNLAPKELLKVHPLGKSPVIEDAGAVIAETGAIIEHVVDNYGQGRLVPAKGTDDYRRYKYWMHAAEGSYMPPLVMELFLTRMETAKMPFFAKPIAKKLTQGVRDAYLTHTTKALFDYLDAELGKSDWLAGKDFTAADIIMSFPAEASLQRVAAAKSAKNLKAYVGRLHARPAYKRALEKGGPYAFA